MVLTSLSIKSLRRSNNEDRVSKRFSKTGKITSTSPGGHVSQIARTSVICKTIKNRKGIITQVTYITPLYQLRMKEISKLVYACTIFLTSPILMRRPATIDSPCVSSRPPRSITREMTLQKIALFEGLCSYPKVRKCLSPMSVFMDSR